MRSQYPQPQVAAHLSYTAARRARAADLEALGVVDAELPQQARSWRSSPTNSAIVRRPIPRATIDDRALTTSRSVARMVQPRTKSPSIFR